MPCVIPALWQLDIPTGITFMGVGVELEPLNYEERGLARGCWLPCTCPINSKGSQLPFMST
jgi:hypothetical protein